MTGDSSMQHSPAASQPRMAVVLKASSKALLTALSLKHDEPLGLLALILRVVLVAVKKFDEEVEGDEWSKEFSLDEFGALLVFFLWKNFRFRSAAAPVPLILQLRGW